MCRLDNNLKETKCLLKESKQHKEMKSRHNKMVTKTQTATKKLKTTTKRYLTATISHNMLYLLFSLLSARLTDWMNVVVLMI